MTALLAVEWRRVLARRLVRVSVALAVLAVLAGGAIALLVSRDQDQASLARARAARQAEVERCIAGQAPGMPADLPAEERPRFCQEGFVPPVPDRRFHYEHLPQVLLGASPFAICLSLLLGASLVGAEWHAGTMATTLTWEPRRLRVLLAKLAAAGVFASVLVLVLQALLAAALLPAGLLRGTTDGIGRGWFGSLAGAGLRVAAVAVLAAAMGFALAAIGRNTAAALGVAFGWLAIAEGAIRGLRPGWTRWLVGDNVALVVSNQPQNFPLVDRSVPEAAALLACYALAVLAVAALSFRRDVT